MILWYRLYKYFKNRVGQPPYYFLIFILLSLGFITIGYIIGMAVIIGLYGLDALMQIAKLDLSSPDAVNALWILQIISTTIPLFVAPVFFAYVIVKDPQDYLKPTIKFPWMLMVIVFCVMFISSPLIE